MHQVRTRVDHIGVGMNLTKPCPACKGVGEYTPIGSEYKFVPCPRCFGEKEVADVEALKKWSRVLDKACLELLAVELEAKE